jgi:hypothetical protein
MLTLARRGNASRLQATRVSITPIDAIGDALPTARGTLALYTGQRSNAHRRFSSTSEKTGGGVSTETENTPPWLKKREVATILWIWVWLLGSLFALCFARFTRDRQQIHTTSSLDTQRARALCTFPYETVYWRGRAPWFSSWLYRYWYDRPYLIRVTGYLKNDSLRLLHTRTVWKPLEPETMTYWDPYEEPVIEGNVEQYAQWVEDVKNRVEGIHSFVPFFIREIRNAPTPESTNRFLEKLDYTRACEALSTRIEKDFDTERGVSIVIYYDKGLYRLIWKEY